MNITNWDARPKGASFWERDWVECNVVERVPYGSIKIRPYDLAATERSQAVKFPDPSACIGMAKSKLGDYFIYGHYEKNTYDDHFDVFGQYCKRSGARDTQIIKQAEYDGDETIIVLPQDPAASGKAVFEAMSKMIIEAGFKVKKDPMPITKSKLTKFEPFASACELGHVYIVKSSFDKKTLEFIYKQLEQFNGERSTTTRKDEFPDLLASGFNYLTKARIHRPMKQPTNTSTTALSSYKKSVK